MLVRPLLLLFLALCAITLLHAQDAEESLQQENQHQQRQVTLTPERIEHLLQLISANCRAELESALASHGQISTECKMEIQSALPSIGLDMESESAQERGADGSEAFSGRARREQQPRAERQPAAAPKDTASTVFAIVGFIVAIFGVAAGYIFYRQSQNPAGASKPKKLSKKKV